MDIIQKRKEDILNVLGLKGNLRDNKERLVAKWKEYQSIVIWAIFAFIAWFGYTIRTKNLPLLQGRFLVGPDEYAFLRYVKYIVEHGNLMQVDYLRYYPTGFSGLAEFKVVSYFMAYLYQFLHFLNTSMTVDMAVILYPAISFAISMVFFFLLVRELLDWRAALIATAFLTVLPAYLFRTIAGVSEKKALEMVFFFMAFSFFEPPA